MSSEIESSSNFWVFFLFLSCFSLSTLAKPIKTDAVVDWQTNKIIEMVYFTCYHCMEVGMFVLRKFVKRAEKIIFSLVFACFRFTEISYFLNFPSNENVRKQHLSANAYSCVNMKFSYTIAIRKDEIFYVVLLRKQAIFHLRLGQLFVDDI